MYDSAIAALKMIVPMSFHLALADQAVFAESVSYVHLAQSRAQCKSSGEATRDTQKTSGIIFQKTELLRVQKSARSHNGILASRACSLPPTNQPDGYRVVGAVPQAPRTSPTHL